MENELLNKLTTQERQQYCLWCIYHTSESYDDNEGCGTHGGTINFDILKKNGVCRYKLTKENAQEVKEAREKSAESLIATVDKIFDDIELMGGYLQGMEHNVTSNAIKLIKHIANKYL